MKVYLDGRELIMGVYRGLIGVNQKSELSWSLIDVLGLLFFCSSFIIRIVLWNMWFWFEFKVCLDTLILRIDLFCTFFIWNKKFFVHLLWSYTHTHFLVGCSDWTYLVGFFWNDLFQQCWTKLLPKGK